MAEEKYPLRVPNDSENRYIRLEQAAYKVGIHKGLEISEKEMCEFANWLNAYTRLPTGKWFNLTDNADRGNAREFTTAELLSIWKEERNKINMNGKELK